MEEIKYEDAFEVLEGILQSYQTVLHTATMEESFRENLVRKHNVVSWTLDQLYRLKDLED